MRDGYYYGTQAVQFSFFMVPKILLSAPPFRGLSMEAKMLYCIAMDRMSLSAKNGWLDEKQRVYIILTISEIMESMCCASQKATKLLQELEKYRLIEKKRQGHCKPNLIYVKDFTCLIDLSQFRNGENHNSGDVKIGIPEFPKSQCNNTDLNNTYFSNTDSFFPSASPPMAADRLTDGTEIREQIREQIEYDIICSNYDRAQLDELVEIMLEVAMNRSPTIKIGRDTEYPTPFVQQRFSKISDLQEIARAVPDRRSLLEAAHRFPACAEPETVYAAYEPASNHGFCGCIFCEREKADGQHQAVFDPGGH